MKTEDIELRLADKSLTWEQRKAMVHELVERKKEDIDNDPSMSPEVKGRLKGQLDFYQKHFDEGTLNNDYARWFAAKLDIHRDKFYADDRYDGKK